MVEAGQDLAHREIARAAEHDQVERVDRDESGSHELSSGHSARRSAARPCWVRKARTAARSGRLGMAPRAVAVTAPIALASRQIRSRSGLGAARGASRPARRPGHEGVAGAGRVDRVDREARDLALGVRCQPDRAGGPSGQGDDRRRSCQRRRTAAGSRAPVRNSSSSSLSLTIWAFSSPARMPALAASASLHKRQAQVDVVGDELAGRLAVVGGVERAWSGCSEARLIESKCRPWRRRSRPGRRPPGEQHVGAGVAVEQELALAVGAQRHEGERGAGAAVKRSGETSTPRRRSVSARKWPNGSSPTLPMKALGDAQPGQADRDVGRGAAGRLLEGRRVGQARCRSRSARSRSAGRQSKRRRPSVSPPR